MKPVPFAKPGFVTITPARGLEARTGAAEAGRRYPPTRRTLLHPELNPRSDA